MAVAGVTAVVSGISVFVNSYGVHHVPSAAVYTTAKNLIAAVLLAVAAGLGRAVARLVFNSRHPDDAAGPETIVGSTDSIGARQTTTRGEPTGPCQWALARWAALAYVGAIGGGAAFVLFFEGLARTTAEPAAFLHDTLVIWVALLALPFLRERLSPWNVGAVVLLVGGQVALSGGVGHLVTGEGQLMVLAATLLWAVETVVAKQLLQSVSPAALASVRMGVGVAVLVGFVVVTGHGGALVHLDASQVGWALATGSLLAVYVGTWMVALSRGRAMDVTSVLVLSVVVTSLLEVGAGHAGSLGEALGLVLVMLGTAAVLVAWPRRALGAHQAGKLAPDYTPASR